jgi:membrane-bound metal-dependent hydrolase YbcI (DUF457 family)
MSVKLDLAMPVIGHTFVGLATAIQFEPGSDGKGRPPRATALALWTPLVVVVSYLPDILSQIGSMAGIAHANLVGHSVLVGVIAGVVIGVAWSWASGLSPLRLTAVTVGAILFHDLLDILQASDRAPFWPFSTLIVSIGAVLPRRTFVEGGLFFLLFAAFVAWRRWSGRPLGSFQSFVDFRRAQTPLVWAARATIVLIVIVALGTRGLRSTRERAARDAARLNAQGRYAEALRIADTADRWPWPVRPGRLDIIRGEAHEGLNQPGIAERYYLRAYEEDPTNFWAVADLAEFYASTEGAAAERRRQVQPYVDELRRKFPRYSQLEPVLARIDRKLGPID